MAKAESDLASLRKREAALADKRVAAQSDLDAAVSSRQEHLLAGDIDDETKSTKLQSRIDTCTSKLSGFDAALAMLGEQIGVLEQQLADQRARAERIASAEQLSAQLAAVESTFPRWLDATR